MIFLRLIVVILCTLGVQQLSAAQLNRGYATAATFKAEFFSAQNQQQTNKQTAADTQASAALQESFTKFMQSHKVPSNLQSSLDAVFNQKQVQTVLAKMNGITNATLFTHELPALRKELSSCGFVFLDDARPHILMHTALPEWVVKLPSPWYEYSVADTWAAEMRNGGRIAYALKIADYCKAKKYPVVLPQKYAYHIPQAKGLSMPFICVVAQALDLSNTQSQLTPEQEKILDDLYTAVHFKEGNYGNTFNEGNKRLIIVDSEPYDQDLKALFASK